MTPARRAYSDAVKWVKSTRPRRFHRFGYAERAVGATIAVAIPVLTVIALLTPGRFGARGSNTWRSGWPLYVLLGVLAVSLIYLFGQRARIRWALARIREPFLRAPEGQAPYENAADALALCSSATKTRFALWWVWGPVLAAVLAVMTGFASAYFLVDAILARFNVGWEHLTLAGGNLVISFLLFALVSGRLKTWRLATAVHRSVTVGY